MSEPVDLYQRWRAVLENVPDAVTEIDRDGTIVVTNQGIPGLAADARAGTNLYESMHERLAQAVRVEVEETFASGETRYREARISAPEGESWWLTRFIPVRTQGDVTHVILIGTEVTSQKRAERALAESEERLQLALEGAQEGVWDWDVASGRVVYSLRWAAMLGYELDEVDPNVDAWRALVHPADAAAVGTALQRHFQDDATPYEVEHRLRTRSGEWKWVLTRGKVVARDRAGAPLRVTGTHRDIDERKEAEAERERLISDLQEALTDVKHLRGLLPICGSCKKIRDDQGYWQRIESYIADHTGAEFSHGICPSCARELYPDLVEPDPGDDDRER